MAFTTNKNTKLKEWKVKVGTERVSFLFSSCRITHKLSWHLTAL
jgi:hypothetical protein